MLAARPTATWVDNRFRDIKDDVIMDDAPIEVVRMDRGIITMVMSSKSPKHVKKVLEDYFRKRGQTIFAEQVKKRIPRFERFEVEQPQVVIRKTKSLWGAPQG